MTYEIKVNELAEEFGVHRNTIRNWITSGTLPATEGPGRRYLVQWEDYRRLCEKYGRKPKINPESSYDLPHSQKIAAVLEKQPELVKPRKPSLYSNPMLADICMTCGSCAGACPISGVDDLDPRKIVRMAVLGLEDKLLQSDWPWKCTMCGLCEVSCPMKVEIVQLMRRLRSKRERRKIPGSIQRGVETCLEKGNNIGIPKDDLLQLLKVLGEEMAAQSCPGFATPVDVRGARLLVTINSKEPYAEPDNLKWWWKIFYAAGESWTIPSQNWEGVNWGLYSGDDNAMRTIVERLIDNMERLNCQALLLPECGHAYYATRYGLEKWFPEALHKYKIYSVFDLLIEYLEENRIQLSSAVHKRVTTYHDPCNYGRKSLQAFGRDYFKEAREITGACCKKLIEMQPNRESNYCCGAGGGSWASPFALERVYHGRMKARQIRESGATLVVTACHNCKDQLVKSLDHEFELGVEVKHLWELVADSLVLSNN